MIKVSREHNQLALESNGTVSELITEAAMVSVLVAQRVGEECTGYDTDSALDLIGSTAREILKDLRTDGVAN